MGRTLLPYSMQLELVEDRFQKYRRSLRRADQRVLDRLFRSARMQLQAGVLASAPNPFDSIALAMLIDLQKQVDVQAAEIELLRRRIAGPAREREAAEPELASEAGLASTDRARPMFSAE